MRVYLSCARVCVRTGLSARGYASLCVRKCKCVLCGSAAEAFSERMRFLGGVTWEACGFGGVISGYMCGRRYLTESAIIAAVRKSI